MATAALRGQPDFLFIMLCSLRESGYVGLERINSLQANSQSSQSSRGEQKALFSACPALQFLVWQTLMASSVSLAAENSLRGRSGDTMDSKLQAYEQCILLLLGDESTYSSYSSSLPSKRATTVGGSEETLRAAAGTSNSDTTAETNHPRGRSKEVTRNRHGGASSVTAVSGRNRTYVHTSGVDTKNVSEKISRATSNSSCTTSGDRVDAISFPIEAPTECRFSCLDLAALCQMAKVVQFICTRMLMVERGLKATSELSMNNKNRTVFSDMIGSAGHASFTHAGHLSSSASVVGGLVGGGSQSKRRNEQNCNSNPSDYPESSTGDIEGNKPLPCPTSCPALYFSILSQRLSASELQAILDLCEYSGAVIFQHYRLKDIWPSDR